MSCLQWSESFLAHIHNGVWSVAIIPVMDDCEFFHQINGLVLQVHGVAPFQPFQGTLNLGSKLTHDCWEQALQHFFVLAEFLAWHFALLLPDAHLQLLGLSIGFDVAPAVCHNQVPLSSRSWKRN